MWTSRCGTLAPWFLALMLAGCGAGSPVTGAQPEASASIVVQASSSSTPQATSTPQSQAPATTLPTASATSSPIVATLAPATIPSATAQTVVPAATPVVSASTVVVAGTAVVIAVSTVQTNAATPATAAHTPIPTIVGGIRTITLAEEGKSLQFTVGETFLLFLDQGMTWSVRESSPGIIIGVSGTYTPTGSQGYFQTRQAGQTTLFATGDYPCRQSKPPCMAPSRAFQVTILVKG
jgi:hypothetical protein